MRRSNIAIAPMGQLYIYILCYIISSILHIATASSSSNPSFTVLLQDSNVHQNNERRLKGEIMVKISNDVAVIVFDDDWMPPPPMPMKVSPPTTGPLDGVLSLVPTDDSVLSMTPSNNTTPLPTPSLLRRHHSLRRQQ